MSLSEAVEDFILKNGEQTKKHIITSGLVYPNITVYRRHIDKEVGGVIYRGNALESSDCDDVLNNPTNSIPDVQVIARYPDLDIKTALVSCVGRTTFVHEYNEEQVVEEKGLFSHVKDSKIVQIRTTSTKRANSGETIPEAEELFGDFLQAVQPRIVAS